ncbi:MAG: N-acetylmuramic acid 6-phosphate etherase [Micavibrio aeruginosavorus]|uniref:N-acetylmuramic acid 6-phosphate etherase n=1 Tax=Micavibrio aeruginosavorus TaxID=349221 RepID=A0A7T5UHF0_9BACT|nr:MAG: N-acetylmuramic acid 6-phosphate etherase [Micavibrio aeruginosavorus]
MSQPREKIATESYNSHYQGVDEWPLRQMIDALLDDQTRSLQAVRAAVPMLAAAAEAAARRLEASEKGRIIYAGAGTSIRIGVQDGTELTPTFGWPASRVEHMIAGGAIALSQAIENAEDSAEDAIRRVTELGVDLHDVCIAVAASGVTPYTVAACRSARNAGALTIGIASNPHSPLLQTAEFPVFVNSGAEPVSGSTRMNAGTAQKAAINMLSTAIMTRLGRVHDGLMVNLIPTNEKLRHRAVSIVATIAACPEPTARQALESAHEAYGGVTENNIKLAILLAKGLPLEQARSLLTRHHSHLRPILAALTSNF